jgi:AcrR family transcriptional regulator
MTEAKGKTATRAAILDAAKKLFAAKGFGAATVRDICTEAGANIALVSRYFGSKSGLYAEVCRSLLDGLAAPLSHLDVGISTAEDWRSNVRKWIGHALRLTSPTRSPEKEIAGIFRQEMFNPSPMRKYFRDTFTMPIFNCLKRLIEMGGSRSEAETLAHMTRIWSQIAFHVVPDEIWRKPFRSAGMSRATWISHVADDIAEDVFRKLKFKRQST